MARVALNSFNEWGVAAAPGFALGAYLTVALCLAAGLYWLMQPTVTNKLGFSKTVATYAKSSWVPPNPSDMPATVAIEGPAPEVIEHKVMAPKTDAVVIPKKAMKGTVVAPKKKTKSREARTTRRREPLARERTSPFWGYASSPSYGYPRF